MHIQVSNGTIIIFDAGFVQIYGFNIIILNFYSENLKLYANVRRIIVVKL